MKLPAQGFNGLKPLFRGSAHPPGTVVGRFQFRRFSFYRAFNHDIVKLIIAEPAPGKARA